MELNQWTMIAGSILPPLGVAIWTLIQWWSGRQDKRAERELNYDQRREAELERERKIIADSHEKTIRDLHQDLENYRKRLNEKNVERFKAWDRAHFWHGKAWEMRNEAAYARQVAESAARLAGKELPRWETAIWLPPFDDDVKAPPPSAGMQIRSE